MSSTPEGSHVSLDAKNLRGIAHPVRVRMLGALRTDGAATATELAKRLGLNTGAASYHLRQLAEYGFITDAPELGTGRERWWKAVHRTTIFDRAELTGDDAEAADAYMRSIAQRYAERLIHAAESEGTRPDRWRLVGMMSDWTLRLTPQELEQLDAEVVEVLDRYRPATPDGDDEPRDSARVVVQVQTFPYDNDLESER